MECRNPFRHRYRTAQAEGFCTVRWWRRLRRERMAEARRAAVVEARRTAALASVRRGWPG
jgi:hypothetical protein